MEGIENPYRWHIRGALVTILIGVLGFAVIVVPYYPILLVQDRLLAVAILTSTTFVFMFGFLGVIHFCWLGYTAKKGIRDLLAGNYLVHWHYDTDEWHHIVEAEWARAKAEARIKPLIVLCLFLVIGLFANLPLSLSVFLDFFRTPLPLKVTITQGLLFGMMTGALLGLVLGAEDYLGGRERYRKNMRTRGEAYIGLRGVYTQGLYVPFRWWHGLNPIGIEAGDPATLLLNVEIAFLGRHVTIRRLRVPISRGKEEEAREVLKAVT